MPQVRTRIRQSLTRHLTPKTAKALDYVPVTFGFRPAYEGGMLENALQLLRDGGADHVVVTHPRTGHPEIWRHKSEVKGIAKP